MKPAFVQIPLGGGGGAGGSQIKHRKVLDLSKKTNNLRRPPCGWSPRLFCSNSSGEIASCPIFCLYPPLTRWAFSTLGRFSIRASTRLNWEMPFTSQPHRPALTRQQPRFFLLSLLCRALPVRPYETKIFPVV